MAQAKKKKATKINDAPAFEAILEKKGKREKYVLRLYVSGMTERSQRAIANITALCEEHLKGQVELEVIDIYQQPILARDGQIVAAPTLVKSLPPPLRKFIGDMSNTERILAGLDLRLKEK